MLVFINQRASSGRQRSGKRSIDRDGSANSGIVISLFSSLKILFNYLSIDRGGSANSGIVSLLRCFVLFIYSSITV